MLNKYSLSCKTIHLEQHQARDCGSVLGLLMDFKTQRWEYADSYAHSDLESWEVCVHLNCCGHWIGREPICLVYHCVPSTQ